MALTRFGRDHHELVAPLPLVVSRFPAAEGDVCPQPGKAGTGSDEQGAELGHAYVDRAVAVVDAFEVVAVEERRDVVCDGNE
jgi:hypothetical protein